MSGSYEGLDDAMEMMGWNEPKKVVTEVSGFFPVFEVMIARYKNATTPLVFGVAWRFCQMQDGVCRASLQTMGEAIGLDAATICRHLDTLCQDGYLRDLTPTLKNRPHIYADGGLIMMKSQFSAHVAESKAGLAVRNASIAQDRLSKDSNKDSNKDTAHTKPSPLPLSEMPVEWQIMAGAEQITLRPNQEEQNQLDYALMNLCHNNMHLEPLAKAFMQTRKIYPNKGEIKGWRVKFQEMYEKGVRAQHVEAAVKQLTEKNLVVSSPFSIYNTAVDLANRPQQMTFEGRMKYNSKGELVADE